MLIHVDYKLNIPFSKNIIIIRLNYFFIFFIYMSDLSLQEKVQSIVADVIKQKVKFEYVKEIYDNKNFYLILINILFNAINIFLSSLSNYYIFIDNKNIIENIQYSISFICTLFSILIKVFDYGTQIGKYKIYIDDCNNIICDYINYNTILKSKDEKDAVIYRMLSGYEKIIKQSSEINNVNISNIDRLSLDEMINEFNDVLKINYKNIRNYKKTSFGIKNNRGEIILSIQDKNINNIINIDDNEQNKNNIKI